MKRVIGFFTIAILTSSTYANLSSTTKTNVDARLQPKDFIFNTESALKAQTGKSARLCSLRAKGWDERAIFRVEEGYEIRDGIYSKVNTFKEWVRVYATEMPDPPISFNYAEPWDMDFSTPTSALHSYWRCMQICDSETAFRHSAPSFQDRLDSWKPRCFFGTPKTPFPDKHTEITVFLSGTCIVNGKQYVALFYRRTEPIEPKLNRISFHVSYFVYLNEKYYRAHLDNSSFGSLVKCMGLEGKPLFFKNIEQAESNLKDSSMPLEFYMFDGK